MKILMVCLGNICPSPMAEGVFRSMVDASWTIDSAGTSGYHDGELPHRGTRKILSELNIDDTSMFSRRVKLSDFESFDYIFAMDRSNYRDLINVAPEKYHHKIHQFIPNQDIPDPWYTGDFIETRDLVIQASQYWIDIIQSKD